MRNRKSIVLITIVALTFIIGISAYFMNGRIMERNTDWYKSSRLVNLSLSKNIKVLQSSDTHGALGDGEYFVVFQFTENQYNELLANLLLNKRWIDLPMQRELNKFIFGERKGSYKYEGYAEKKIPEIIRNGKYFFLDQFVKKNPQYNGISIFNRPSNNFIFGLLDHENRKLYILKYDS